MKKFIGVAALAASFTVHAADTVVSEASKLPTCPAPVARISVGQVGCKSTGCAASSGDASNPAEFMRQMMGMANGGRTFPGVEAGMQTVLSAALRQTNCFEMQDMAALEALRAQGLEPKIDPVEFMVAGDITEISCQRRESGAGPWRKTTEECALKVDARIIDATNARIVNAGTFVADSASASASWDFGVFSTGNVQKTPMEGVMRDVLGRVAVFATEEIVKHRPPAAAPVPAPAAP